MGRKQQIYLRKKYLKKCSDVFKKRLEKGDTIRCDTVKIETKKDSNIKPINCRTVQLHYRKAADRKIKVFLKAGIIKKCNHFTPWLSRGMDNRKRRDEKTQQVKVRLVTDFSPVNRTLQSPN